MMTPSVDTHEDLWFHEHNGPNLEQELFDEVSLSDESASSSSFQQNYDHHHHHYKNGNSNGTSSKKKSRGWLPSVIRKRSSILLIVIQKYILRLRNQRKRIPSKKKLIMATILASMSIVFFTSPLDTTSYENILTTTASSSSSLQSRLDQYPYNLLKDVDAPMDASSDIPLFWHIHKAGGSTMKHIFSCLRQVQTRKVDNRENCPSEPPFQVCKLNFEFLIEQMTPIINADFSSLSGIATAKEMHLMDIHPHPFILTTSRVYEALPILTPQRKGRLFVVFRHPVERAISKYYYTKIATWEQLPYQSDVANMTLAEYANSKYCQNNWMTRRLVHKMKGEELTMDDLEMAKEILRTKALILLLDELETSVHRMREYFQWDIQDDEQKQCLQNFIHQNPVNTNNWKERQPEPTKEEWMMIRAKNELDVLLMAYAKILFREQGELLFEPPKPNS